MEPETVYYKKAQWIETAAGNKVSRTSILCASQNIKLNGKTIIHPKAIIRGDLAAVRIGRYCTVSPGAVVRPAYKKFRNGIMFFSITVGDYVHIGERTLVNAATVGSHVHIGNDVVVGRRCVIMDCCRIEDGTILPADTVVPPFTIFAGNPGRYVGDLTEATKTVQQRASLTYYEHFKAEPLTEDEATAAAAAAAAAATTDGAADGEGIVEYSYSEDTLDGEPGDGVDDVGGSDVAAGADGDA